MQCGSLFLAQAARFGSGRACRLCPGNSDIDLFCYREGVINLDTEIAYRALDLGVAEQKLHGAEISGALVNQRRFGASERVVP